MGNIGFNNKTGKKDLWKTNSTINYKEHSMRWLHEMGA